MPEPKPFDFQSLLASAGTAFKQIAEDALRSGGEGVIEELQAQVEGLATRLAGARAKVRKPQPARPARIHARQVREAREDVVQGVVEGRPKKRKKAKARRRSSLR